MISLSDKSYLMINPSNKSYDKKCVDFVVVTVFQMMRRTGTKTSYGSDDNNYKIIEVKNDISDNRGYIHFLPNNSDDNVFSGQTNRNINHHKVAGR